MWSRYRFPPGGFNNLRRQMDRLLDEVGAPAQLCCNCTYPALNVWDADDALHVEAELPGVKLEDLEIFAAGNELTIKGRRAPRAGENRKYHRQERETGEFTRVLTLPADVDADKIEAVLNDGVLSLRLPKAESAKPRKIRVRTA